MNWVEWNTLFYLFLFVFSLGLNIKHFAASLKVLTGGTTFKVPTRNVQIGTEGGDWKFKIFFFSIFSVEMSLGWNESRKNKYIRKVAILNQIF